VEAHRFLGLAPGQQELGAALEPARRSQLRLRRTSRLRGSTDGRIACRRRTAS
jgi:hypothetical protein